MFEKIFHTASYRRKLPVPFYEVLDQEFAALHGGAATNFSWDFTGEQLTGPAEALLEKIRPLLADSDRPGLPATCSMAELAGWLNKVLHTPSCLHDDCDFPKTGLSRETVAMTRLELDTSELARLNRLLLEEAFPEHIKKIQDIHLAAIYRRIHAGEGAAALCFSGGGIRSATFALGVAQGLARHGLLGHFDYLSTVSGGGYIGSWLSSWIHRAGEPEKVFAALKASNARSPTEPEPATVSHLRKYSNYLTPKLGAFSADTWVLIGTYLRNLLLNWLVFLPILLALFALPRVHMSLLVLTPPGWIIFAAFVIGAFFLVGGMACSALSRPTVAEDLQKLGGFWPARMDQAGFLRWCLAPICLGAVCLTAGWAWIQNGFGSDTQSEFFKWFFTFISGTVAEKNRVPPPVWNFCLLGALLHLAAWLAAECFLRRWRRGVWLVLLAEMLVTAASGALGGLFLWYVARDTMSGLFSTLSPILPTLYGCFAIPVFLMVFLVAATIFIGISSKRTTDEDREWWARMGAWVLIVIIGWCLFGSLVLFAPLAVLWIPHWLGPLGGLSGLFTLIVGHSAGTSARKENSADDGVVPFLLKKGLVLAAPLSLAALAAALSLATSWTILFAARRLSGMFPEAAALAGNSAFADFSEVAGTAPWWLTVGFAGVCALTGWIISRFININKFSLHAIYRNRLVRAYLGASNSRRNPNPFTGFDPLDNLALQDLRSPADPALPQRPLHIVNMALNLVTGDNLAWQQRKAETFTASTLHCGNFRLGYRFTKHYARSWEKIRDQNLGLSLGTAVAISGAAASPNQGYHSSPMVAILMTLFNVRLGWWLGNPGAMGYKTFQDPAPKSPVWHFVKESLGLTDSTSQYVYLSDGGHFENLGLYEMVLRRCRLIVVSDAGCDPDCSLEDLGNAIRKIRVDLGVKISLEKFEIFSRDDPAAKISGKYCSVGEIDYSTADPGGQKGVLIYLKPALLGNEPQDIFNYARTSEEFPHESTADQWFSESQFESYRALGERAVDWIYDFQNAPEAEVAGRNKALAGLIEKARTASGSPPSPPT